MEFQRPGRRDRYNLSSRTTRARALDNVAHAVTMVVRAPRYGWRKSLVHPFRSVATVTARRRSLFQFYQWCISSFHRHQCCATRVICARQPVRDQIRIFAYKSFVQRHDIVRLTAVVHHLAGAAFQRIPRKYFRRMRRTTLQLLPLLIRVRQIRIRRGQIGDVACSERRIRGRQFL